MSCEHRPVPSGAPCCFCKPKSYPLWVTTGGWGKWTGKRYRWEPPQSGNRNRQNGQKPRDRGKMLAALAKARAAKQAKKETA